MTGSTSLPSTRRAEALPEAETPSYSPLRISCTISSEVPATLLFTVQPVFCFERFGPFRFDVACPGDEVDFALAFADFLQRFAAPPPLSSSSEPQPARTSMNATSPAMMNHAVRAE